MKFKACILSAFLSVLLFLTCSFPVKANEIAFPAFPEPVEGKSSTHYLITYNAEKDTYFLLKPFDPLDKGVYVKNRDGDPVINFRSFAIGYRWRAGEGAKSWEEVGEFKYPTNLEIGDDFLYSSFDLFYFDGELFFQKAPIKASFLTQMKQVKMGATLTTLVSLIPLLIGLVVSFLSFRKALAWLLKVLHKS